jgi:surface polysaccharide O-acyltransferase-like enzyme
MSGLGLGLDRWVEWDTLGRGRDARRWIGQVAPGPAAYTQSVIERHRLATYDILRVGATLGVIAIHVAYVTIEWIGPSVGWLEGLKWLLDQFMVPTFFFISGALVWARYDRHGVKGWSRFMGHRVRIVLLPYLGWSLYYWYAVGEIAFGSRVWFGLFFTGDARFHLYFVPILMVFYLLTPLAKRLVDRSPALLIGLAVLADFGTWSVIGGGIDWVPRELTILVSRSSLFLPYIAIGAVFGSRDRVRKLSARLWPMLVVVAVVAMYASLPPLGPAAMRTWTSLAVSMGLLGAAGLAGTVNGDSSVARVAGRLAPETYLAYLAHPLVIGFAIGLLEIFGIRTDLDVSWSNAVVFAALWSFVVSATFVGVAWWHRLRRDLSSRCTDTAAEGPGASDFR